MMFYSLCGAEGQTRSNIPLWHVHLCKIFSSHAQTWQHSFPCFPFAKIPCAQQYGQKDGWALQKLHVLLSEEAFTVRDNKDGLIWVVSESLLLSLLINF